MCYLQILELAAGQGLGAMENMVEQLLLAPKPVVNYPGPDRAVRLDQLRKGKAVPRRYRNRRIGDFLKELEITEGRSTGIPKILRAMKHKRLAAACFRTR